MKKVFSLLLVVAMLVSLSLVASAAPANAAGGMHIVITETDADVTVSVQVANVTDLTGVLSYLVFDTDKLSFVSGSQKAGTDFSDWTITSNTKVVSDGYKMEVAAPNKSSFKTFAGTVEAFSYKLAKADASVVLSEADFAYSTSTIKVSKVVTAATGTVGGVTAGTKFTTKTQPTYFTIDYVDDRAPIVENPFSATASGTTITCIGKVDASATNYGVVFTAESTLDGTRAQKYYGAMPGDTVKDYYGNTTFTFGAWDGNFEIILQGVHAGAKELDFFVNDTVIEDTNFTLTVE
ncbi:MAG: hypothetical protein J6K51_05025 [Clostridia bacterium]|nr:hypothetical protein [Clostridia bacterium]